MRQNQIKCHEIHQQKRTERRCVTVNHIKLTKYDVKYTHNVIVKMRVINRKSTRGCFAHTPPKKVWLHLKGVCLCVHCYVNFFFRLEEEQSEIWH